SIALCCQARSLPAVPQGARPGKAGDRWCEWDAVPAVVVTISVGGSSGTAHRRMTTGPPYRWPGAVDAGTGPRHPGVGPRSQSAREARQPGRDLGDVQRALTDIQYEALCLVHVEVRVQW